MNIHGSYANRVFALIITFLFLVFSAQAHAFYTVHKVKGFRMFITFQSALDKRNTETIKEHDLLDELTEGRPGKKDQLAAVIDCNDPSLITLVVWDMGLNEIAEGSDTIPLNVVEMVIDRKGNKDRTIALIDADALIGSGLIVASVKFKESKNKHLPPDLNPDDETFCISKVDGISAAGHIETEEGHGIVWGGKFKFNRPMATVSSSPFE